MLDKNIHNKWPIAKPGLVFIILFLSISLIFFLFKIITVSILFFLLFAFSVWFFRDPKRSASAEETVGLSPADGRIIKIEHLMHNPYTEEEALKISIFMNVFSVHVNRVPINGRLIKQQYHPGKFFNASVDKASEQNERNSLIIETDNGKKIAFVQIAGFVARRIVSWVHQGDKLIQGQRFGMIKFGSRVDLYLPATAEPLVKIDEKVSAGLTPIWRQS